ncbi:hypothetical protein RFI_24026 [Reticulomyxa filosa]|uniref:Uncharacterized protein n=1 Tax=Reticulomyxa filosa TaxID=46433 RepID=X6MH63_RETFI|nr:hypothetical protein RFI_24026 [Reticulomyxa filosa]|eukprot:ETO13348.1 hypothetical protein RFI_24026 [Reticulomyxa filosa]
MKSFKIELKIEQEKMKQKIHQEYIPGTLSKQKSFNLRSRQFAIICCKRKTLKISTIKKSKNRETSINILIKNTFIIKINFWKKFHFERVLKRFFKKFSQDFEVKKNIDIFFNYIDVVEFLIYCSLWFFTFVIRFLRCISCNLFFGLFRRRFSICGTEIFIKKNDVQRQNKRKGHQSIEIKENSQYIETFRKSKRIFFILKKIYTNLVVFKYDIGFLITFFFWMKSPFFQMIFKNSARMRIIYTFIKIEYDFSQRLRMIQG